MKTLLPLLALSIAGSAIAASSPTPPVRQDVSRLVLLPGPYLTSPSKHSPLVFSDPGSVTIAPVQQTTLRFEPATPASPASGTLQLRSSVDRRPEFAPAPKAPPPRDIESLRFDAKLPPVTPPRAPLIAPKPKPAAPAESEPKRD